MLAIYKKISDNDKKMIISSLLAQKQPDRHLLLLPFQIAFAAEVLDGKSPFDVAFDAQNMRTYLI